MTQSFERPQHNRERLSTSNVKIYGLKQGRLHDRYILVIGRNGLPLEGYHLSNSFQTVAQNYPLLITPIPTDILYELKNYTLDLIQEANESSNDSNISVLFDTEISSNGVVGSHNPLHILENELAGDLFSVWFNEPLLKGLYGEDLKNKLKSLELLESNSFHDLKVSGLLNCIHKMQNETTNFQELWELIGHILANSHIMETNFDKVSSEKEFLLFLSNFLSNSFKREHEDNSKEVVVIDPSYFTQTIDELIKESVALNHFIMRPKNNNISWAEFYAVKLLWHYKPDFILDLIEREVVILKENPDGNHAIRLSLFEQIVSNIYKSVEFRTISNVQKNLLIKSDIGLVKWFGWVTIEHELQSYMDMDITSELSDFSKKEKIQFIGWSLHRNAKRLDLKDYYEDLIAELYRLLPNQVSNEDVDILIESAKGYHQQLSWSEPWLFRDVIYSMLAESRVSYDYMCEFWMQEIIEQFESTDENDTIIFSPNKEQITTQVCAYLWANSSQAYRNKSIKVIDKNLRKQAQIIQRPLAKSINYKKWNMALKISIWILILARLFKANLEDMKIDVPDSLEKLISNSYSLAKTRAFTEWSSDNDFLSYLEGME